MHILIAGINGYLGHLLSQELKNRDHEVFGISRDLINGDSGLLRTYLTGVDVVINLSGAGILQRWTRENKKIIFDSRIKTTRHLITAINSLPKADQPKKYIQASAIGLYTCGERHKESSRNYNPGFLGKVVEDWEKASDRLSKDVEKHIFRLGLVLGKKAKTISKLKPIINLGIGGTLGNGKQAFPFVHEKDLANAFIWAIEKLNNDNLFNLCAPQHINNKDFIKSFAKKMKRPAIFPVPAAVIKAIFGEASTLLLESPEVDSRKIIEAGFKFRYPDIDSALEEILS